METIGELIRKYRKMNNLTQEELGKKVNKSPQVISNWERGYTQTISADDIANLSRALQVSPEKLIGYNQIENVIESSSIYEVQSEIPDIWKDLTKEERKEAENFMHYLKLKRSSGSEHAAAGK